jgi:hypothetical protein
VLWSPFLGFVSHPILCRFFRLGVHEYVLLLESSLIAFWLHAFHQLEWRNLRHKLCLLYALCLCLHSVSESLKLIPSNAVRNFRPICTLCSLLLSFIVETGTRSGCGIVQLYSILFAAFNLVLDEVTVIHLASGQEIPNLYGAWGKNNVQIERTEGMSGYFK